MDRASIAQSARHAFTAVFNVVHDDLRKVALDAIRGAGLDTPLFIIEVRKACERRFYAASDAAADRIGQIVGLEVNFYRDDLNSILSKELPNLLAVFDARVKTIATWSRGLPVVVRAERSELEANAKSRIDALLNDLALGIAGGKAVHARETPPARGWAKVQRLLAVRFLSLVTGWADALLSIALWTGLILVLTWLGLPIPEWLTVIAPAK